MRVLFICSGNSRYCISPFIRLQAESLKKIGVQVEIYSVKGKGVIGYIKNIPHLRRFLFRTDYNIIHAHYGLCGIIGQFARQREKLIVSFMGDDLIGSVNINGKYTTLGNTLVWLNKLYARNKFDYIITKSYQLRAVLPDLTNIEVIPNGVDFNTFYPVEKIAARKALGINLQKKIIIFVSDPERNEKNFCLANNAFNLIKNSDITFLPIYNKSLKDLNLFYNAADLLILTSFHEGSPNVIKEAMACNLPIVSTDVGDVREVIGNTEGCYLTSFEIKDVADKIKLALNYGQRTNGRNNIQHLDINVIAKRIIDVYQRVLEYK